jgi:hypothetical protein
MLSLPVELRLPIIHHIRDSIPQTIFKHNVNYSIEAIKIYHEDLAALSLYHREWTAIAQSELFKDLFIPDDQKMKLLLELLRESARLREYSRNSSIALLGDGEFYGGAGLEDDLVELAEYCPDLRELSCDGMAIPLVQLGTSCQTIIERVQILIAIHVAGHLKKLRKLNLASCGLWSGPPAPQTTVPALSITTLSIRKLSSLFTPLDPASLPSLRSLTVSVDLDGTDIPFTAISPLLPQLNSLSIADASSGEVAQHLALSTSLKVLSVSLFAIETLHADTQAIIQNRIESLRIEIGPFDPWSERNAGPVLNAIISGRRVLKKVILDGEAGGDHHGDVDRFVPRIVPSCKKANVELWKENFEAGNGKVNLDSELL